ncbi:lysozyme [Cimex lectularius]|uniref:lysozyme n=1 Tax=Cimex lectularius TaxID=79782 RepID=A0A8I6RF41_CIMLE|nr:lysozyme [Cimex lectularius]
MKFLCVFLTVVATLASASPAKLKKYDKCELREELRKRNFPTSDLDLAVCIFMDGSKGLISIKKEDDLEDNVQRYGLFQLGDDEWCSTGSKGGKCNANCQDFLKEDITEAATCALQALRENGFPEWPGEYDRCQSKPLTFDDCN